MLGHPHGQHQLLHLPVGTLSQLSLMSSSFVHFQLCSVYPCLAETELRLPAFAAHRIKKLQTPRPLIEEIDLLPDPPKRPPKMAKPKPLQLRCPSPLTGRVSPLPRSGSPLGKQTSAKNTASPASSPAPSPGEWLWY